MYGTIMMWLRCNVCMGVIKQSEWQWKMVESKALSEPIQMQTNYIHKCLPLKHRLPDHDHLFTSLLFLFSLSSAKAVTTKKHQYCVKSRWRKFVFFFIYTSLLKKWQPISVLPKFLMRPHWDSPNIEALHLLYLNMFVGYSMFLFPETTDRIVL